MMAHGLDASEVSTDDLASTGQAPGEDDTPESDTPTLQVGGDDEDKTDTNTGARNTAPPCPECGTDDTVPSEVAVEQMRRKSYPDGTIRQTAEEDWFCDTCLLAYSDGDL